MHNWYSLAVYSNNPMRLRSLLERQPGAGVLWSGITGRVCQSRRGDLWEFLHTHVQVHNELPGNSSMELVLTLVPILPGLQVYRLCRC